MTKALEFTDDGLLRRMMAGDEEAFTLLYRRRQPPIYRFALHMSGNAAVAEDVTQEVFMTLIRDATRFDPARGTLGGYLFGVARNLVRRRWEQERNSFPLPPEDEDFPGNGTGVPGDARGRYGSHRADDEFASLETVGRVRQAVATLPANYREVVVLCELEEMSYEEAAEALDCPIGTVRSRLHRARALLVEKLREPRPLRRAAVGE
ncbi:MAG TPA: sigma-70 family RNA polymerase sigma factor [Candidatus Sulfotelmatobacter sp.]|nr:sigma-70 family RNA polymerase sigma factor [Candidatus Sulfotelmatobacter sp.]